MSRKEKRAAMNEGSGGTHGTIATAWRRSPMASTCMRRDLPAPKLAFISSLDCRRGSRASVAVARIAFVTSDHARRGCMHASPRAAAHPTSLLHEPQHQAAAHVTSARWAARPPCAREFLPGSQSLREDMTSGLRGATCQRASARPTLRISLNDGWWIGWWMSRSAEPRRPNVRCDLQLLLMGSARAGYVPLMAARSAAQHAKEHRQPHRCRQSQRA
jgi:hypothetical protein